MHIRSRVFFAVLAKFVRRVSLTPVFFYTRVRVHVRTGALIALSALVLVLGFGWAKPAPSAATVSDNLNFQARLQSSAGAIVPDGYYNVEFKLYNVSSSGTALWTEDYLNSSSQGVHVVNGYLSANLGSITSLPSNLNWDQSMYLSMNIGGTTTGTPSWDGEMTPRLKLTAVPYAFQAKSATQLQAASGSNSSTLSFDTPTGTNSIVIPDASGTVCLENSSSCGFALSSGSGNYIQNGTTLQGGANFNIRSASTGSVTATIQALTGQSVSLMEFKDENGNLLTSLSANGTLAVQDSSAHQLFKVDTSNGNVSVGSGGIAGTIQIGNTTGAVSQTINIGNNATSSSTTTVVVGSGIGSSTTTVNGGTGGILFAPNGSSNSGVLVKPVNDSTYALQVQNASGKNIAAFDTSGGQVVLGDQGASGVTGGIVFNTTNNANAVTLKAGATATAYTLYLPTAKASSSGQCLVGDTSGQLSFTGCTSSVTFNNGGNSFGGTTSLGTNDNYTLNFRTNNSNKLALDTSGNLQFQQASTINAVSAASGTQLIIKGGDANSGTNTGGTLLLQGGAGNTSGYSGTVLVKSNTTNSTAAFQVQDISGNNFIQVDTYNSNVYLGTTGSATNFSNVHIADTSGNANQTVSIGSSANTSSSVTIEAGTGSSAILIGNGATAHGIQIGTGAAVQTITVGSTNSTSGTTIQGGSSGISLSPSGSSNTGVLIKPTTADSTAALQIQNNGGKVVAAFDTTNGQLILGDQSVTNGVTGTIKFNTANNTHAVTLTAGATASNYTLTLPTDKASGNGQCLVGDTSGQLSFTGCTSSSTFTNGGNSFGGATSIGTNDGNALSIRTNNSNRLTVDTSGNLQFLQASVINAAAATSGTQMTIKGGDANSGTNTGGALLLQGGAGNSTGASGSVIVKSNTNNSTTAFQIQNANGKSLAAFDTSNSQLVLGDQSSSGITGAIVFNTSNNANSVTLQAGATSTGYTLTLPTAKPGGAGQCLVGDTSGQLSFTSCSGGTNFNNGGNSFGGATSIGTNDGNALSFRTNNSNKLSLDTSGNLQFQQASTINALAASSGTQLTIKGGDANSGTNTGGTLLLQGGAGNSTGASGSVIVQSNTNNSTTAFQVQNAAGTSVLSVNTTTGVTLSKPTGSSYLGGADISGSTNSGTSAGTIFGEVVSGRYIYAVSGANTTTCSQSAGSAIGCELKVFDSSVPGAPAYIGGADISGSTNSGTSGTIGNNMSGVAVSGHYVFTLSQGNTTGCSQSVGSADGCELKVFDVSKPSAPTYVGGVDASGTANSGTSGVAFNGITISGRYAFITASGSSGTCAASTGNAAGCELQVYDITNPAAPAYVGGADFTGTTNGGSGSSALTYLTVSGKYVYTVNTGNSTACSQSAGSADGCELKVFDVSNPASPTYVGGADVSGQANTGTGSKGFSWVSINGRYAYIASDSNSTACSQSSGSAIGCELQVYDLSTPSAPAYVGGADVSGSTNTGTGATASLNRVVVSGSYAYVTETIGSATACSQSVGSAGGCEFQTYDVSNPSAPAYLGGVDNTGSTNSGTGFGTMQVYAAAGRNIYVMGASSATACAQAAGSAVGCELQVYDMSGMEATAVMAHSLEAGILQVDANGNFVGNVTVGGGLAVGQSAEIQGDFSAAGKVLFRNNTNSSTELQVQDASANVVVAISTNNYASGANAANAIMTLAKDSGTSRSINAAGSVNASGADYAEWIPWTGIKPSQGSIIEYNGSNYIVSSQNTAAFVGNDKFDDNSILVTFAGQVPVRVTGPVNVGDILVDNGDGTAKAVSPAAATVGELLSKLAVAQEANTNTDVKLVQASVGTTSSSVAQALQQPGVSFDSLNVSTVKVTSNTPGTSGLQFTNLTSNSTASSDFTGILGVDANGNVGLVDDTTFSKKVLSYWSDVHWDPNSNELGIGTDTPSHKLDVANNNSGYVARVQNTSTSANGVNGGSNGLLVQLGADINGSPTGNNFVGFAGGSTGAATVAGKIQGGANSITYTTNGSNYAEYFKADPNKLPQAGEIVSLDTSNAQSVVLSGSTTAPFGIVSNDPGYLGNGPVCAVDDNNCDSDYQKYNVIVGMNGQVSTKVSVANGAISIGDPIMASTSTPGVGVKATGYSRIIGYAEEATSVDGTIKVLIQPGIFDPVAATNLQGSSNAFTLNMDLHVTGNTTLDGTLDVGHAISAPSISIVSASVSGDLTVVGSTTTGDLHVLGSAQIQTLTVNGVANIAGDIKLTGQVNTRQATIKTFKASKPIAAGSVVIINNSDGHEGEVTTSTTANDVRVIGVAVTDAQNAGDNIDVAISGWVQVRVDTNPNGNGQTPPAMTPGQLVSTSIGEGTVQAAGSPAAGSILGKSTSKQDTQSNLVWILVTLQ